MGETPSARTVEIGTRTRDRGVVGTPVVSEVLPASETIRRRRVSALSAAGIGTWGAPARRRYRRTYFRGTRPPPPRRCRPRPLLGKREVSVAVAVAVAVVVGSDLRRSRS